MTTVARWLREGWRWWIGELAAMLPHRWQRATTGRARGWTVRLDLDPPVVVRNGEAAVPSPGTRASVLLAPAACLTRVITLPAMGEADIARLVDLQISRLMPLPPGTGLVHAVPGPLRDGVRDVTVVLLPVVTASKAEATTRELGLEPTAILVAGCDFLPELRRLRGEPDRASPRRVWWRIVSILLLANLALFVATDVLALRNLERLVQAHGQAADGARRARRRVLDGGAQRQALLAARTNRDPLAILADLDRRLPEGVRVDRLMTASDGIHVTGVHRGDVDVIGALRAGHYPGVRAATGDALAETPEGQPFDITFDWPVRK